MVLIAEEIFNHPEYDSYFKDYPFELSTWQKFAIKSIVDSNHSLVVAPTGNGKTLPAEFAIKYFYEQGKKVIYTSPIKALSNQKFWDLKAKFPEISFGLLTGDIKDNPDADCIICTTEILRNNCYNIQENQGGVLDFNVNLSEEVGAVVFDEVHYINDKDRGNVWEECFMLLPQNVLFIMLSATIANPERFAGWVENIKKPLLTPPKHVVLCSTNRRIVPSEHYFWFSTPQNLISKKINDKPTLKLVTKYNHKLSTFKKGNTYDDTAYHNICKMKYLLSREHIYGKQSYVFNTLLKHLKGQSLLPAICFVYSRRNVEKFANMCYINLFEDDCKKTHCVEKECLSILMKLSNYKEYLALPEYKQIISGLQKGIGIHHAGILPVFKEMIELLFGKGYIRLLFATETFAVGINFPAPTVIFTDVQKFDGSGKRMLLPHEFTQQSGRAGRRGFDTKGNVIHLLNLFEIPELTDYKIMMNDNPQTLISKFKISYPLVLNLQSSPEISPVNFASSSMIQLDINAEIDYLKEEISKNKQQIVSQTCILKNCPTPEEVISQVSQLRELVPMLKNKKRYRAQSELYQIMSKHDTIESDLLVYTSVSNLNIEKERLTEQLSYTESHIQYNIDCVNNILLHEKFLEDEGEIKLTEKGVLATKIKEIHSLMFADVLTNTNYLEGLSAQGIAALLSSFTNVRVAEEVKTFKPSSNDYQLQQVIEMANAKMEYFYDIELKNNIYTGIECEINYDLTNYIEIWWNARNECECMTFLRQLYDEKGIFIGEFVKAILKINSIANELEKIAEFLGNMELLSKVKEIHENTFKFVVTNQSLYV